MFRRYLAYPAIKQCTNRYWHRQTAFEWYANVRYAPFVLTAVQWPQEAPLQFVRINQPVQ